MPSFKDHFSGHASEYSAYRPRYPDALFDWIAGLGGSTAWDCATGSGQAAVAMASRFEVVATDASATQIAAATEHPRVRYAVGPAEASGLADDAVDLVTVAQALHWFDHPRFFAEAERVVRPGGHVVAWCYELFRFGGALDAPIARLYDDRVGGDWPPERRHIEAGYRTVGWPWPRLEVPDFGIEVEWDVARVLGYLRTWSACKRYEAREGVDPVTLIEAELREAWGDVEVRRPDWPITVLASRVG